MEWPDLPGIVFQLDPAQQSSILEHQFLVIAAP